MKRFQSGWTALDVWQCSPCSFVPCAACRSRVSAALLAILDCSFVCLFYSHPDKNKDDAEAAKHFMDVNDANEVLSDPDKRAVSAP
jgi:hypothetical protein